MATNDNTASDVWADTAYRSRSNEAWLRSAGRVSRVHRKKGQMTLFIRTIGIARAETKITLANLVYNVDRLILHERRAVMG